MTGPEVSNYDIVNHWFDLAADRMELRDDIREVVRASYREVQVQVPVMLGDGKIHVFKGFRRVASTATRPRSTSPSCSRSRAASSTRSRRCSVRSATFPRRTSAPTPRRWRG
jgi:hypothetical protein